MRPETARAPPATPKGTGRQQQQQRAVVVHTGTRGGTAQSIGTVRPLVTSRLALARRPDAGARSRGDEAWRGAVVGRRTGMIGRFNAGNGGWARRPRRRGGQGRARAPVDLLPEEVRSRAEPSHQCGGGGTIGGRIARSPARPPPWGRLGGESDDGLDGPGA